jgi:phage tail sheath protein FI
VDIQLLAVPGMRHTSLSDYAITAVENRFDALYIMDIEERDTRNIYVTSSDVTPRLSVTNTTTNFRSRALDSSFAAAYFPDVVMTVDSSGRTQRVPPSVAVIGAYSQNDRLARSWFAPAGQTRGILSSVTEPTVVLSQQNLDTLYDAKINPIISTPDGVVVFGQKTLLATESALDRVNVRRLLIEIRRQVRTVANSILFEPNRESTLANFRARVNPILQRVQEGAGVVRYRVQIDTSTTTQADVENNTIRGKIYVQPTRTAEFVALDFVVTNAGAEI